MFVNWCEAFQCCQRGINQSHYSPEAVLFTFSKMAAGMYLEHYLDSKLFYQTWNLSDNVSNFKGHLLLRFSLFYMPGCQPACATQRFNRFQTGSGFRLSLFAGITQRSERGNHIWYSASLISPMLKQLNSSFRASICAIFWYRIIVKASLI